MKTGFIEKGIELRQIVILVVSVMVILGIYGLVKMPKNEFPTTTVPQGVIIGVYPGASSVEVERQLAEPLDDFIFGFKEIKKSKVVTQSREGMVFCMVELEDDVKDIPAFWSRFKHSINTFKSSLPAGVLALVVQDDFGDAASLLITLESGSKTYRELEGYMDRLKTALRTIDAVSNLQVYGLQKEQISVYLDQERMSRYALNTATVMAGLAGSNAILMGTSLGAQSLNTPIHIERILSTDEDVAERIVFTTPEMKAVRLKDIADIRREYPEPESYITNNGVKAILLGLEMRPGNNIVEMGHDIDRVLVEFSTTLPDDVSVYRITDQAQVVNDSVNNFLKELLIAILAVILVVILLLPIRVALVAAGTIPVTIFMSLAIFYLCKIELNTVTLAALIVTLGMIVDNSIVILDSYLSMLDEGMGRKEAAVASARQFFPSILSATLAISVTFFPFLIMATGLVKPFLTTFPWAVSIILFLSLFVAVLVIPFVQQKLISKGLKTKDGGEKGLTGSIQTFYNRIVDRCFNHPWMTSLAGVLVLVAGTALFAVLPIKMMPVAQRNQFAVEITLPNGTTLDETAGFARMLEDNIRQDDRVLSVTSFIGMSSPRFHTAYAPQLPGSNFAQFIVNTTGNKATEELLDKFTPMYSERYPDAMIKFKQLEYNNSANPIEIRLTCTDRDTLKKYAMMVEERMRSCSDLYMIRSDMGGTTPGLLMIPDAEQMSRYGIQPSLLTLYNYARYGNGIPAGSIVEDGKDINIVIKASNNGKPDASTIGNDYIAGYMGATAVPLREVVSIEPEWTDGNLVRRNGIPTITVMACTNRGINSTDAESAMLDAISDIQFPENVTTALGGDSEFVGEILPIMVSALVLAIGIIFIILLLHFSHLGTALLVLGATVLFSVPATSLSIIILGYELSVTSFLGIVSLMGIVVRNAIIMVDYSKELVAAGEPLRDAVMNSAKRRMRPIFLTSAAASMGVIPMILGGSTLWAPMGVVVFFGTWITMLLVLTVFPVLYYNIAKSK